MGEREKPKRQEKKVLVVGENTGLTAAMTTALQNLAKAPDGRAPFYRQNFNRSREQHPRDVFDEKNKKKKWRPWEIAKIWAPSKTTDGKIFAATPSDSRPQRRARIRNEAYAYMKEHFPGEPRKVRRELARARMRNFSRIEKGLAPA